MFHFVYRTAHTLSFVLPSLEINSIMVYMLLLFRFVVKHLQISTRCFWGLFGENAPFQTEPPFLKRVGRASRSPCLASYLPIIGCKIILTWGCRAPAPSVPMIAGSSLLVRALGPRPRREYERPIWQDNLPKARWY